MSADAGSILVVEDSATQALQLSLLLEANGYRVARVGSAEAALDALSERRPDLLIVDYRLPGMNGDELARLVRMNAQTRALPVVMLTDEREGTIEQRGLDSGANAYVPKSADKALLLARLRALLKHRSPAELTPALREPATPMLRRARVLVVEEEPADRSRIADLLEREGYQVRVRRDGTGLEQALEAGDVDCVLVGIDARSFDALALCRRLDALRNGGAGGFELIGLGGDDVGRTGLEGFAAGLDDLFPRADEPDLVAMRVRAAIRRRFGRAEGTRLEEERRSAERALAKAQAEAAAAEALALANRELAQSNAKLRETQAQLVQAAKMASLGELVAGIAHEINNPLAFLTAHRDTVARLVTEAGEHGDPDGRLERARDRLDTMRDGLHRIRDLVTKLRTFSRFEEGSAVEIDVPAAIAGVLALLAPKLGRDIAVEQRLDAPATLRTSPALINQVVMNFISNAADAIGGKPGRITIATSVDDGCYSIAVGDSGPGVAPAVRDRVFEPFFTTKDVGSGTGLGLAIAYGVVRSQKGRIEVGTSQDGGALFTVTVPQEGAS